MRPPHFPRKPDREEGSDLWPEAHRAVYAAIAGNFAIVVPKFVVATVTGSSPMLSEGIHSVVDTGNGGLILLGIRRSRKPPEPTHPCDHGKELYFWTLHVAILLLSFGDLFIEAKSLCRDRREWDGTHWGAPAT